MRTYLFLFILCFFHLAVALPIQDRRIEPEALSKLTAYLNIPKDEEIIAATQKRWLRKPDQERWEMAELSLIQREFVLHWAKQQHIYDAWVPSEKEYDQALILGATTGRMQLRLNYLKQLWEQGIRFQKIVWLTGDRPLDSRVDDFTNRSDTESAAAHILWDEIQLPQEMRDLPTVFIASPMKKDGKRPTTQDTIEDWLKRETNPCKALFVSDQPFCGYQFAVIKSILPHQFSFEVVGQGVDGTSHPAAAAITLDTIARWIYQESLSVKSP